jgi:hypothetical protein
MCLALAIINTYNKQGVVYLHDHWVPSLMKYFGIHFVLVLFYLVVVAFLIIYDAPQADGPAHSSVFVVAVDTLPLVHLLSFNRRTNKID